MSKIPTQVVDFNLYNVDNKLLGVGEELTLPSIVNKTIDAMLPGGIVSVPSMTTEDMESEINFNVFDKEAGSIITVNKTAMLVVRAAEQGVNTESHAFDYKGLKITMKGITKEVNLGSVKKGGTMDSKIKQSLTYIKIEDNTGFVILEHDKANSTYVVNGENIREGIDQYV